MTRSFFVIYQGGFGVIERIREEIDFGKKITFTVNHCNHVILTWIVFQTDFILLVVQKDSRFSMMMSEFEKLSLFNRINL